MNKEQFLITARVKHGNEYDYSKVEYLDKNQAVIIICKHHGEFLLSPIFHLRGTGCLECGRIAYKQRQSTNIFIQSATLQHGDKYNYSKTVYIDEYTKVCISSEHGEFYEIPSVHLLSGENPSTEFFQCEYLLNKNKKNINNFVQQATLKHGIKYSYAKTHYHGDNTKVEITCKTHGYLYQTPIAHLSNADDCVTCQEQAQEKSDYLTSKNTPEAQKRTQLCLFTLSSIKMAEESRVSLKPHYDDAIELLTAMKNLKTNYITVKNTCTNGLPADYNCKDASQLANTTSKLHQMLYNSNEYMTSKSEFQQLYIKYKNNERDLQYSIIKKIVEIYDIDDLMTLETIDIIIGILEDYLRDACDTTS